MIKLLKSLLVALLVPVCSYAAGWTIADIFNGLMAIPNMIAIFALSGVVVAESKDFFKRLKTYEANK